MSYTSEYVFTCEPPTPEEYGFKSWGELGEDWGLGSDFNPDKNIADENAYIDYIYNNLDFAYWKEVPSGMSWMTPGEVFCVVKAIRGLADTFESMSYDFNEFYTSDLEELEKVLNKAYLDDDDVAEINAYAKKHRHNFGIDDLIKYVKKKF